jgi:hypothetical protein
LSTFGSEQYQTTKPRPDTWRTRLRGISSMMTSCIVVAPQASFSGAFTLRKVRRYSPVFIRGFVGITFHQAAWSERISGKAFTGRQLPAV